MLDLTTLLQQRDEKPAVQPPPADPLAEHEIALTLRLQPAVNFAQRTVQGVIGIPNTMPIFLNNGVTLADLITTIEALYARLTAPTEEAIVVTTEADPIASVPASSTSQLDIF